MLLLQKLQKRLPDSFMDLSILLNAYKNISAIRKLTDKEWLICRSIEEKFVYMLTQLQDPTS